MTEDCPRELIRLYREGRVLPFVGAGTSMSVAWEQSGGSRRGPSWDELVNRGAELLGFEDPDLLRIRGTGLQILEYFASKKDGLSELTNWLHHNMQPPDEALQSSPIHAALNLLTRCPMFYTTNFDDFLERSLKLNGRNVNVVTSERDMNHDSEATQVIKFHGDFNSPEHMVLSESQYEKRMRLESALDLKLRSDVLGRAILFIGYSFRDPNIAYLFRTVNESFSDLPQSFTGKRAYIIVSNPSDFELQLFHSRKIEVIPAFGTDRTEGVAQILEALTS